MSRSHRVTALLLICLASITHAGTDDGATARQSDGVMNPDALREQAMGGQGFSLPQLRIYDSDGYLLQDAGRGYAPGRLKSLIGAASKAEAGDTSRNLADELTHVTKPDGSKLPDRPAADLFIVKLWAEWCEPCHELTDEVNAYLDDHPDLNIHVYNVEADPMKGQ